MSNQPALIKLRNILASLYQPNDSRRVVYEVGLNEASIKFDDSAINVWHTICLEAQKLNKVNDLISIALAEFPTNPELVSATQEFRMVVVPFLIVAMTQSEATTLFDETIFNDPHTAPIRLTDFRKLHEEWTEFLELQERLTHQGLPDLQTCYKDSREAWRPIYCDNVVSISSVKKIIEGAFEHLNKTRKSQHKPMLTPVFVSDYFFLDEGSKRDEAIELLEKLGGVVVIDAVSMFHPMLSRQVSNAGISAHPHIAVLVVSPVDATVLPINQHIENLLNQDFERACSRFRTNYDRLCEIDLGNILSLKRWFIRAIPEITDLRPSLAPLPENLESLCQQLLGGQQQRGFYQFVSRA